MFFCGRAHDHTHGFRSSLFARARQDLGDAQRRYPIRHDEDVFTLLDLSALIHQFFRPFDYLDRFYSPSPLIIK